MWYQYQTLTDYNTCGINTKPWLATTHAVSICVSWQRMCCLKRCSFNRCCCCCCCRLVNGHIRCSGALTTAVPVLSPIWSHVSPLDRTQKRSVKAAVSLVVSTIIIIIIIIIQKQQQNRYKHHHHHNNHKQNCFHISSNIIQVVAVKVYNTKWLKVCIQVSMRGVAACIVLHSWKKL